MKAYPPRTRLPIYAIALTTLLQFALNVHAQQDLSRTETRVNEILSKMTLDEKLDALSIVYTEGVFMSYRGYEKNHIQPQYPFGYGLSYTKFRYSDLSITPSELSNDRSIEVRFRITNIGQRAGAETAQLYVGEENPKVPRPIKELKGFQKVYLQPGESKEVTIQLNQRSLAFYNVQARAWEADPGVYTISVGASSQDIRLNGKLVNPSLSLASVSESEPVPGFDEE